ncbi:hypothetical protein OIU46_11970 [Lacticaseibacillus paracasei]
MIELGETVPIHRQLADDGGQIVEVGPEIADVCVIRQLLQVVVQLMQGKIDGHR